MPAGVETTYRSLGNLLFGLLSNPDQLDAVRADRSLLPQAIEEAVRWEAPAPIDHPRHHTRHRTGRRADPCRLLGDADARRRQPRRRPLREPRSIRHLPPATDADLMGLRRARLPGNALGSAWRCGLRWTCCSTASTTSASTLMPTIPISAGKYSDRLPLCPFSSTFPADNLQRFSGMHQAGLNWICSSRSPRRMNVGSYA